MGTLRAGARVAVAFGLSLLACSAPSPDTGGQSAGAMDAGADADTTGAASDAALFDAGVVSASTWIADLTIAYCTWAIRCGQFPDTATCQAYASPQFGVANFDQPSAAITAVSDGNAQFDPTQAASCLNTLSNLACDVDFLNLPSMPASCATAFSGTVSDGGVCIDDVECAYGSMCGVTSTTTCKGTCVPTSASACRMDDDCPSGQFCAAVSIEGPGLWGSGVCEAIVPSGAAAGELCGMPVQCASGLYCGGGPAPAACQTDVEAGAMCGGFNGATCAAGLACVLADDGTTSTCMAPAKLGEACTSLFQCGAQYTLSDIICDETGTHTCVTRPSAGPCIVVNQGRVNTCDPTTSYCNGSIAAATCTPWVSRGAPCIYTDGVNTCGLWDICQGSVCTPALGACTPQ